MNGTDRTFVSLRGVSKTFCTGGLLTRRHVRAVDDVSLEMPDGAPSILAIIGESGSGKTTLARLLLRLHTPSAGAILLAGKPIERWSADEFRRTVQPVFQNPFEAFSLYQPVEFYLRRAAINLAGARDAASAHAMSAQALLAVGLARDRVAGKYAHQFSGGELQRIAIARALIPQPRLIVADEPVSMIDASLRTNIVNLFLQLKQSLGISFVYITHDLSTAYYVADTIAIMHRGRIVESGDPRAILRQPRHDYTRALLDAVPRLGERWTLQPSV